MTLNDLLTILDMDDINDIEYSESFCNLMETEADFQDDLFYQIIKPLDAEDINVKMREYLSEIISGIADDCIDFYTQMSSYKRNFGGMVNYYLENEQVERIHEEVLLFRKWYTDENKVVVQDLNKDKTLRVSVCEALVLGRMEKLSAGNYDFDFTDAMDLEWVDFEDYVEDNEDEDYENFDYDSRDSISEEMFYEESSGEGYIQ